MNRKQLIQQLTKEHGYPNAESARILATILTAIQKELKQGNLVRLRNFGTFRTKKSHGRLRAKFTASKNFFTSHFLF